MKTKTVIIKINDNIATITLDRPDVMNALNKTTIDELDNAIDSVKAIKHVRALIITGGEKQFAAGADISEMLGKDPEWAREFGVQETFRKIEVMQIPVIAAISGFALGGGLELAMACDIRICHQDAKLGLPELKVGIFPGGGGTQRLPRIIGIGRAKEMIYRGSIISAHKAFDYGLCNIITTGSVIDAALELAHKLSCAPPLAFKVTKKAMNMSLYTEIEAGLDYEADEWAKLFDSEDQREGMTAFIEKRKPEFRGV